jgi:hypothetical protein
MSLTRPQRIFEFTFGVAVALLSATTTRAVPGAKAAVLLTGISWETINTNTSGWYYYTYSATTNDFDKHGTLFQSHETNYSDFLGIAQADVATTVYTYDKQGNLILSVQNYDTGTDGTIDLRVTSIYTNLPNGQSQEIDFNDSNLDGAPDYIFTTTFTYDTENRIVKVVFEADLDADGVVDSRSKQTWTYDLANHRIVSINTFEPDGDGVVDDTFTTVETDVTDDRGYPISGVIRYADGSEAKLTWIYDKFGHSTQWIKESASGTETNTLYWDHRGQVIRSAPHPNSREVFEAKHGSLGNRFRR